jgi:hypothetical protein
LDLDNDGRDEIIYVADNVPRISELNLKTQKTYPYAVSAGILMERSPYPQTFESDTGEYVGGTDAMSRVVLKGVVSIAYGTREIALCSGLTACPESTLSSDTGAGAYSSSKPSNFRAVR